MDKYLVLLLLWIISFYPGEAQSGSHSFELSGRINSKKDGVLILMPVNDTGYYSDFHCNYITKVEGGKFLFSGSLFYPMAFMVGFKIDSNWAYISDIFFIDTGYQSISCNLDSSRVRPTISNKSMAELTGYYSQAFLDVRKRWDDYYGIRGVLRRKYGQELPARLKDSLDRAKMNLGHRQDSVLEDYVKRNPHSYVALWETIADFSSGYKKEFDSVFCYFSDDLKKTSACSVFAERLTSARVTCIGCEFPVLSLCSLQHLDRQTRVPDVFSKYTLVDFWFSHCAPCIEQFSIYKGIYETYSNKGFQIVGISTDKSSQINDWKGVIKSHQLTWPQFLDVDGSVARQLSISMWPSNFLLDEKGTIVLRNVDPPQLAQFLKANLR